MNPSQPHVLQHLNRVPEVLAGRIPVVDSQVRQRTRVELISSLMKKRPAEIRRQQLPQAIVTPWVDLIYCGGASILVLIGLFVMSAVTPENRIFSRGIDWNNLVLFSLLINFPHCIACSSIWKIRNPQVRKQLFSHLAVK